MKRKPQTERRGIAATEFALVAPVFVMLFMGIVEISEAINANDVLSTALREGGRLASMDYSEISEGDNINAKVEADIKGFLQAADFPANSTVVTIVHAEGPNEGSTFEISDPDNYLKLCRIEASVPYYNVSQYPVHYLSGQTLSASFVFRMGRVQLVE